MIERTTPETDAAVKESNGQWSFILKETCQRLERERDEAKAELARTESILLDPHAVFVNFLHGKIAKLDWAKLEHIHGPHPARMERDEAREDLEEEKRFHHRTHSELIQTQCKLMDFTQAIISTLEENRHLADGDDCTLAKLKSVVPDWK